MMPIPSPPVPRVPVITKPRPSDAHPAGAQAQGLRHVAAAAHAAVVVELHRGTPGRLGTCGDS